MTSINHLQHSLPDPTVVPEELLWEILSWLPIKSLMRFKTVSRLWRSIIRDPAFARLHRRRRRGAFRGLLIYDSCAANRNPDADFFYLRLDVDGGPARQLYHHLTVIHGAGMSMASTEPVNGLVCFYYRNHSYLLNIATGERLQLPDSEYTSQACTYHLGFDAVRELYKLLKICPVYDDNYDDGNPSANEETAVFVRNLKCEILTLGEGLTEKDSPFTWRSVDPPDWDMRSRSVCFDGVLYWSEPVDRSTWWAYRVIAFDLPEEKFSLFSPMPPRGFSLCRFGPQLSLQCVTCRRNPCHEMVRIICYHRSGDGGSGGELFSTELNISLRYSSLRPSGMLPDGKVLLHQQIYNIFPPAIFYLYDPTTTEFENIEITQVIPSALSESLSLDLESLEASVETGYTSYHEESILPLRCLISPL